MPSDNSSYAKPTPPPSNEYVPYRSTFLTGIKISGNAPAPKIKSLTIISGGMDFEFRYQFENEYYSSDVADEEDVNYNNYTITQIDFHTGSFDGFVPSPSNLYQSTGVKDNNDMYQSGVIFVADAAKGIPSSFKLIPYDFISSGEIKSINQEITPTTTAQSFAVSLDPAYYAGNNYITAQYPLEHPTNPSVTATLTYTGNNPAVQYLGAMIKGEATTSQAEFILTAAPNETGYALLVSTSSL